MNTQNKKRGNNESNKAPKQKRICGGGGQEFGGWGVEASS